MQQTSPNFFSRASFAGDEDGALDLRGTFGVVSDAADRSGAAN
jgi:hypothetical protein